MKYLLVLVLLCGGLVAQTPGAPTFLQVGTLSCAARMYTPTMLQVWCFKDAALKVLQINIIDDVSDGTGFELTTSDSNTITGTSVAWLFLTTIPAPTVPPTVLPPPVVAWRATITRADTTVSTLLSGVL